MLANEGKMTEEQIKAVADSLRAEHFAQTHTDMVGDEEETRGYLKGIAALEQALYHRLSSSGAASR